VRPETLKLVEVTLEIMVLERLVLPVTLRLVPVAEVKVKRLVFSLVEVTLPKVTDPEAFKLVEVMPPVTFTLVPVIEVRLALVEVRFVKIPVLGVVLPIGVLSMVPALMVRASTTMAFVTELFGKLRAPVTARLVEVTLVKVELVKLVLVVKVMVPLEKVMSEVPVTMLVPL